MSEQVSLVSYHIDPDCREVNEAHSGMKAEAEIEGRINLGGNHVASKIRQLAHYMGGFRETDEISFISAGIEYISYPSHLLYDGNWFDAPYHFLQLLLDPELRLIESHSYNWKWSEITLVDFLINYGKKCFLLCIIFE